jgi:trimethylamine:corrinoid methyltransferase-like protein
MNTTSIQPLRYLSRAEMDAIHQAALRILERTGMWVDHTRLLDCLRAAGGRVDMDRRVVKFPPAVVEAAVARLRRNFQDPDRWPKRMSVRYSPVRFDAQPLGVHEDFSVSAGGFCCFVGDLEGRRRPATLEDVRQALRLADRLDQITYTGLPCAAQEVPVHVRPVVMAAELAKATRKLGGIETFRPEHVGYIQMEELLSPFFDCLSWGAGDCLERDRFEKRAAAQARALLAQDRPPVLRADQEAAIDEIVSEATRDLKP